LRLVLCDDHALLLDALQPALDRVGHTVVAVTSDPDAALEAVREHRPDVLLLDVGFPNDTGVRVVGDVLQTSPETKVVMLSAGSDPDVVSAAIDAGASGFIRKDHGIERVVRGLDRVMGGDIVVDPELLRAMVGRRRAPETHDVRWLASFLTDREREVLSRIGAGQSTAEMAEAMGVTRSTARTHVQSVLQKLGVHTRLQAATAFFGTPADRAALLPRPVSKPTGLQQMT
jgi:two-component system, NarL family, nitrate/nitrite response regulator NarL